MQYTNRATLIWSIAELLRGAYKQAEYGKVILPFTLLRRLDAVLARTKQDVLDEAERRKGSEVPIEHFLLRASKKSFYNVSPYDFQRLLEDADNIGPNLHNYLNGFSENARDIFDHYNFRAQIDNLDQKNRLYNVVKRFAATELHPDVVKNADMGLIFEELIRRFAELSNETAGEHYTPRDVIRLMVDLLFTHDDQVLRQPSAVRSLYDPTAGTGGMLSVAAEHLARMNPDARLEVFGQEINDESYAICKADMLIKGADIGNIRFGDTLTSDAHRETKFDYMLSNPPFGVDWTNSQKAVVDEAELGMDGRFGAGLPRISDGSLLFLQHLISKMRGAERGGSRIGIVFNASPLFTGGAGAGETEIRKWIIKNDWLEAIIALPPDMFYNTGINTYIWLLTDRKAPERRGKIQLIDASGEAFYTKMRKSLGKKRKELKEEHIARIVQLYGAFEQGEVCKIFDNDDFGYHAVTVERPLRLRFEVTAERLAELEKSSAFKKGKDAERLIQALNALAALEPGRVYLDRAVFETDVRAACTAQGLKLRAPEWKAIWNAMGERDPEAAVCLDSDGDEEPDPDLRDTEIVPLKENIEAYFRREVLPYVPDAWIDPRKTKIGYEIPFNRHFYTYTPPRELNEIDADLFVLYDRIQRLLREVTQ